MERLVFDDLGFKRPGGDRWVLLPVLRGAVRTELRLRVVATPEPATAQLLTHLGLRLPKGTRFIANAVPKHLVIRAIYCPPQHKRFAN